MSGWMLILVVIVIVAALAYMAMQRRNAPAARRDAPTAARDYGEERETSRLGGMSDEDRAWEAASRERNRATELKDAPPPKDA